MKSASIFLVLAVITGAARGAQEGGCGRAGALRCDSDGRHLSACTQGGNWWRVRDCGASHASCVDGRCVPQLSSNATRAGECTPSTWGCKDCDTRQYCSTNSNWHEVGPCAEGFVCVCGVCESKETHECHSSLVCSPSAVGVKFPNPSICTEYLHCREKWEPPVTVPCYTGESYNPCEEDCFNNSHCWKNEPCDSSNNGELKVFSGNPSVYYFCVDGMTILYKCENDTTFYPSMEKCLAPVVLCPADDSNSGNPKYDSMFSVKKHVSYDDCTSPGTSPSGCSPGEKWAFPDDECQYYLCVSSADVRKMKCAVNTKFDATAKNCVVSSGSCLNV